MPFSQIAHATVNLLPVRVEKVNVMESRGGRDDPHMARLI